MRLRLFLAFVHITKYENQITFKLGDIEWEASYGISSLVPSVSTRNDTTVTETMCGRKNL
jgi:hypothetical protein